MVIVTCDWSTSKWLFQGLLTSILSGVGFVFISLALEYVKRYSREKKEREQQIILQKLLRGELTMDWNKVAAVMPVSKTGFLSNQPTIKNGSLMFNTYKKYGGFLGFGRGYYASGRNSVRELGSEIGDSHGRVTEITNWLTLNGDKTGGTKEQVEDNTANVLISGCPSDVPSCESFINSRKLQSVLSRANLSSCSLRSRPKSDLALKSTTQGSVCRKMCEEMCQRIVKEHPFIAPLLRRDLLQELRLGVACESKSSNSHLLYKTASNLTKLQPCKAICQQPECGVTVAVKEKLNYPIKRAISGSRVPLMKKKSRDLEHDRSGAASKSSIFFGKSKKAESATSKNNLTNWSDYRRFQRTDIYPTILNKKLTRGRSCSLSDKNVIKRVESECRRRTGNALTNPVICASATAARTCEDIADQGTSVDPTRTRVARRENYLGNRRSRDERAQINNPIAKKVSEIQFNNTSQATKSEYVIGKDRVSAESRMMDIINALKSWGFPMKNTTSREKKAPPNDTLQQSPNECQTEKIENRISSTSPNSTVLFDLIETLASSPKNRKILRQISSVLDKDTCKQAHSCSSRLQQIEMCQYVTTRTTGIKQSVLHGITDKEKKTIDGIKTTDERTSPRDRGWRRHRTPNEGGFVSERSKSVKLWRDRKLASSKRTETSKRGSCIHTSKSELLATSKLDPENNKIVEENAATLKQINKAKQPPFLRKHMEKNVKRTVADKTKKSKELLHCNKTSSPRNKSSRICVTDCLGEREITTPTCQIGKEINDTLTESGPKIQHVTKTKLMINKQDEDSVQTNKLTKEDDKNNELAIHQPQIKPQKESASANAGGTTNVKSQQATESALVKDEIQTATVNKVDQKKVDPKGKHIFKTTFKQRNIVKRKENSNVMSAKNDIKTVFSDTNVTKCRPKTNAGFPILVRNDTCLLSPQKEPIKMGSAKKDSTGETLNVQADTNVIRRDSKTSVYKRNELHNTKLVQKDLKGTIIKGKEMSNISSRCRHYPKFNNPRKSETRVDVLEKCQQNVGTPRKVEPGNDASRQSETINGDTSGKSEPSNDTSREKEPSNDTAREKEPSNDTAREKEPSNDTSREKEPSNDTARKREPSNDRGEKREPSNDIARKREPSNNRARKREPSNDMARKREPSNNRARKREPSNDTARKREPSNNRARKREPSNDMARKREPSNDIARKREPSNNRARKREPSNDMARKREPSNDIARKREPSNNRARKREPSNDMAREKEPSNNTARKREPSNDRARKREPSNDMAREKEPSNDTAREKEPSNDTVRKIEPSIDTSSKREPSNDTVRRREPSNVTATKKEPSNVTARKKELSNVTARKKEPSNVTARKKELSNVTATKIEPSNGMARKKELSNVTATKIEPSNYTARRREPSNDMTIKIEPSNDTSRISEPSNDTSRISEPSNDTSRISEPSNDLSRISEPSNDLSRISEPSNDTSRISEPSNDTSRISDPSNDTSRISEPSNDTSSNDTSRKMEPSNGISRYKELSNEKERETINDALSNIGPSSDPSRTTELNNLASKICEHGNDRSGKKSRPKYLVSGKIQKQNEASDKKKQRNDPWKKQELRHKAASASFRKTEDSRNRKRETIKEARKGQARGETSSKSEPRNEISLKSKAKNETSANCQPNGTASRKCEPGSKVISRNDVTKTDTSRRSELSNQASKQTAPKSSLSAGKLPKSKQVIKSGLTKQQNQESADKNNDITSIRNTFNRTTRLRQTHSIIKSAQKNLPSKVNMPSKDRVGTSVNNTGKQVGKSGDQKYITAPERSKRVTIKSRENNGASNETKKGDSSKPRSRFDQYQNKKKLTNEKIPALSRKKDKLIKVSKCKDNEELSYLSVLAKAITDGNEVSEDDKELQNSYISMASNESSSTGFAKDSANTIVSVECSQDDIQECNSEMIVHPSCAGSVCVNALSQNSSTDLPYHGSQCQEVSLSQKIDNNLSNERKRANSSVILKKSVLDDVVRNMSTVT